MNTVQGTAPSDLRQFSLEGVDGMVVPDDAPVAPRFIQNLKESVKAGVRGEESERIYSKSKELVQQGKFLELTLLERCDATWQSYIYNLPRGTMKFILNASLDTLPSKANLKVWVKCGSAKCALCSQVETLNHVISSCPVALRQLRWNYRYDSLLHYLGQVLDKDKFEVYIDIAGQQTTALGTLPPDIVVSPLKPDCVVVDRANKEITLFELTCPGMTQLDSANRRKLEKYQHFERDISSFKVQVTPFEVEAATGHLNTRNKLNIKKLHRFVKKGTSLKLFTKNVSAIVAMASYFLWNCRNNKEWISPRYIEAPFKI